MSARTRNTYTGSLRAFVRWCIADRRMSSDPLVTLKKSDERCDLRRQRRALTEAELARLLYVTEQRPLAEYGRKTVPKTPEQVQGKRDTWTKAPLDHKTIAETTRRAEGVFRKKPTQTAEFRRLGRERSLIYQTLVLTGLRRGELAMLTWGDLALASTHYRNSVLTRVVVSSRPERRAVACSQACGPACGNSVPPEPPTVLQSYIAVQSATDFLSLVGP